MPLPAFALPLLAAAGGAGIGALTNDDPLKGALIGGGVGLGVGAGAPAALGKIGALGTQATGGAAANGIRIGAEGALQAGGANSSLFGELATKFGGDLSKGGFADLLPQLGGLQDKFTTDAYRQPEQQQMQPPGFQPLAPVQPQVSGFGQRLEPLFQNQFGRY